MSPLEALWIAYAKLVKKAAEESKGKRTSFEKAYWLGYRKALSDVGTELTMKIHDDIIDRMAGEGSNGATPVQQDPNLPEVQVVQGEAQTRLCPCGVP